MKLGCLGPRTNSVIAARNCADSIDDIIAYSRMEDVFDALDNDKVDRIVIPVRNSITGEIKRYTSLINGYEILDEFAILVKHYLGCANGDHSMIRSHPEVLKQCCTYLDVNYPDAVREPVSSTDLAARVVSETKKGIAIANLETCLHYGLKIVDEDVVKDNYSTFLVLRK